MNSIINQLLLDIENAAKSWGDVIVQKENNTNLSVELNKQPLIFVDVHEGMPVLLPQQIMDNDGVTFSVDISIFRGQNRRIDFVNPVWMNGEIKIDVTCFIEECCLVAYDEYKKLGLLP